MARYSVEKIKRLVGGEFLQHQNTGQSISNLLIDSRKVISGKRACFFALRGKSRDGHGHILEAYKKGVRCFIVDRSIQQKGLENASIIKVSNGLEALQLLCKKHRDQFDFPVMAITGSNGKTIVKEWLSQLLKVDFKLVKSPKSYNSQVGVPLSIWQCKDQHEFGIFEAGISEIGEMAILEKLISPNIGLITNIGSAHDENFESRQQKAKEKFLLFRNCEKLIYCKDDKEVYEQVTTLSAEVVHFSWSKLETADLQVVDVSVGSNKTTITSIYRAEQLRVEIPFIDAASIENAIHCWATMLVLGFDNGFIQKGLAGLSPVAMRLELKEGINNCLLINDSYNSDLMSLEIAADFIEHQKRHQKKTLILSDILESGLEDELLYREINELIQNKGISKLIGIGPNIIANSSCFSLQKECYNDTMSFLEKHDLNSFSNETILLKGARRFNFEKISKRLQEQVHSTVLEVNLGAVQHNLNFFKSRLQPQVKLMAMVKAFSYGAGAFEVANLLQFNKIDYLGVAYPDEGVTLRKAGITVPIMVMNPDENAYDKLIDYQLEPEIFDFDMLAKFERTVKRQFLTQPYPIHLKIETGMNRLGFSKEDVPRLIQELLDSKYVVVKSVFSHLATSDDPIMIQHTQRQVDIFNEVKKAFCRALDEKPIFHILNSSGILALPDAQFDMVRLGLGLYGIASLPDYAKYLQEVSALKTRVSQVKELKKGSAVGYSRAGVLARDSKIATIPIGYADGLRRSLGNKKGHVLIKGQKSPIVGNVCMDMCMVDVTDMNVQVGDQVVVFGKGLSIEEFAQSMDTIPYEALTGISPRVKRVYFQE